MIVENMETLSSVETREKEPVIRLFHVSGFSELADKGVGDSIVLTPGPQGAEGKGVYFSENVPRFEAAEGARKGVAAVIVDRGGVILRVVAFEGIRHETVWPPAHLAQR